MKDKRCYLCKYAKPDAEIGDWLWCVIKNEDVAFLSACKDWEERDSTELVESEKNLKNSRHLTNKQKYCKIRTTVTCSGHARPRLVRFW